MTEIRILPPAEMRRCAAEIALGKIRGGTVQGSLSPSSRHRRRHRYLRRTGAAAP